MTDEPLISNPPTQTPEDNEASIRSSSEEDLVGVYYIGDVDESSSSTLLLDFVGGAVSEQEFSKTPGVMSSTSDKLKPEDGAVVDKDPQIAETIGATLFDEMCEDSAEDSIENQNGAEASSFVEQLQLLNGRHKTLEEMVEEESDRLLCVRVQPPTVPPTEELSPIMEMLSEIPCISANTNTAVLDEEKTGDESLKFPLVKEVETESRLIHGDGVEALSPDESLPIKASSDDIPTIDLAIEETKHEQETLTEDYASNLELQESQQSATSYVDPPADLTIESSKDENEVVEEVENNTNDGIAKQTAVVDSPTHVAERNDVILSNAHELIDIHEQMTNHLDNRDDGSAFPKDNDQSYDAKIDVADDVPVCKISSDTDPMQSEEERSTIFMPGLVEEADMALEELLRVHQDTTSLVATHSKANECCTSLLSGLVEETGLALEDVCQGVHDVAPAVAESTPKPVTGIPIPSKSFRHRTMASKTRSIKSKILPPASSSKQQFSSGFKARPLPKYLSQGPPKLNLREFKPTIQVPFRLRTEERFLYRPADCACCIAKRNALLASRFKRSGSSPTDVTENFVSKAPATTTDTSSPVRPMKLVDRFH